jgi:hypothetical protein
MAFHLKPVRIVGWNLSGERNGLRIGIWSNIAVKDAVNEQK